MTIPKTPHIFVRSCSALALALVIWSPAQAEPVVSAEKKSLTEPKAMENCQAMQEQKQKMLDGMKAQDTELTAQLAKMNAAPDDKKIGMIATIVTRMVEQRIAMDAQKAKMEDMMMQHMQMMMQHMRMGKEAMAHDPVSKAVDKK